MNDWKTEAVQDDRIMADGRPAFAWYNELVMLRKAKEDLKEQEEWIKNWMMLHRILSFNHWESLDRRELHIVVDLADVATDKLPPELSIPKYATLKNTTDTLAQTGGSDE